MFAMKNVKPEQHDEPKMLQRKQVHHTASVSGAVSDPPVGRNIDRSHGSVRMLWDRIGSVKGAANMASGFQLQPNGYTGGANWRKEPAVKKCGFTTVPTVAKTVTVLMALFGVGRVWLFHYQRSTGKLCSPNDSNACVTSTVSLVLVSIARFTAGALYPSIAFCILSKCYATRYFLHHSWLSLIVDLEPTHSLHTYFGLVTLICSVIHGLAHTARYVYEHEPDVMIAGGVNRSGIAALLLMLFSVLPMAMRYIIARWTFEVRKTMHMLFVPMMVAICFHTPSLEIMAAVFLAWYLADRLYFTTKQTFFISHPKYKAIGRGTLVRFELPRDYKFKAGAYIQVNCPAISSSEWHPFSLFPVPGKGARAGFHAEAVGDWTQDLFRLSLEDPRMPLWISAAQPSVLENAMYYENVILICTGAGITPAVSLAHRFSNKKNVHLMWMSRDVGMVATFEKQLRSVNSTVHLTGKQSDKTKERMVSLLAPKDEVVTSRPVSRSPSMTFAALGSDEGSETGKQSSSLPEKLGIGIAALEDPEDVDIEEGGEKKTDHGHSDKIGMAINVGGVMTSAGGDLSQVTPVSPRRRGLNTSSRGRGQHPVSIKFGRPDIEGYITGTIHGTAVTEWAIEEEALPLPLKRQTDDRLSHSRRISKEGLMVADLSVVEERMKKNASGASNKRGATTSAVPSPRGSVTPNALHSSWVVLYCGANAKVEQALVSACTEHGIAWRKEYFSAW